MNNDERRLKARRDHITETLAKLDKQPAKFEWALRVLKDEPEAKHRRLRSYAKVNMSDVEAFSELLAQEFGGLVYFFANYKTGTPTPSKFSEDHPITLYENLLQAVRASLEVERDRPPFNGPNFNRPDIYCRWPWSDEAESGDLERVIGGRCEASDVFRLALQYRDNGRWFVFRYRSNGYIDARNPKAPFRMSVADRSKLPAEQYPETNVLLGQESEFFSLYDLNDLETTAFVKRAHALWRRISTKNVGAYNPISGEFVESTGGDGRHWRSVGKRALEGAFETPPRYADFASQPSGGLLGLSPIIPKSDGPALMIGPRPKKTRKARATKDD
jgi:hypothetical protein